MFEFAPETGGSVTVCENGSEQQLENQHSNLKSSIPVIAVPSPQLYSLVPSRGFQLRACFGFGRVEETCRVAYNVSLGCQRT